MTETMFSAAIAIALSAGLAAAPAFAGNALAEEQPTAQQASRSIMIKEIPSLQAPADVIAAAGMPLYAETAAAAGIPLYENAAVAGIPAGATASGLVQNANPDSALDAASHGAASRAAASVLADETGDLQNAADYAVHHYLGIPQNDGKSAWFYAGESTYAVAEGPTFNKDANRGNTATVFEGAVPTDFEIHPLPYGGKYYEYYVDASNGEYPDNKAVYTVVWNNNLTGCDGYNNPTAWGFRGTFSEGSGTATYHRDSVVTLHNVVSVVPVIEGQAKEPAFTVSEHRDASYVTSKLVEKRSQILGEGNEGLYCAGLYTNQACTEPITSSAPLENMDTVYAEYVQGTQVFCYGKLPNPVDTVPAGVNKADVNWVGLGVVAAETTANAGAITEEELKNLKYGTLTKFPELSLTENGRYESGLTNENPIEGAHVYEYSADPNAVGNLYTVEWEDALTVAEGVNAGANGLFAGSVTNDRSFHLNSNIILLDKVDVRFVIINPPAAPDAEGSENDAPSVEVRWDTKLNQLNVPETDIMEGYKFGWYTSKDALSEEVQGQPVAFDSDDPVWNKATSNATRMVTFYGLYSPISPNPDDEDPVTPPVGPGPTDPTPGPGTDIPDDDTPLAPGPDDDELPSVPSIDPENPYAPSVPSGPGASFPGTGLPAMAVPAGTAAPFQLPAITPFAGAAFTIPQATPAVTPLTPQPIADEVEAIAEEAVPMAAASDAIADEETPLAAFEEELTCLTHWPMLIGIIATALYGFFVIRRRLGYADDIDDFTNEITGKNQVEQTEAASQRSDARQVL